MYEININPVPEVFCGKEMFFWCVFGVSGENRYNCGHGWEESVALAAEKAYEHYKILSELPTT